MLVTSSKYLNTDITDAYQIDGDYLIPHEYDFTFKTPEEDFFDAETKNSDGWYFKFKKDGSLETSNGSKKWDGRYEKNGDFIIMTYDDGHISGALVKDDILNECVLIRG